jgi:D-glycero-alpha-D-manno-heptose 1-phosphate guanylyltransferase
MAQIAGRPFLEILLDQLILQGIDSVILSVGYRSDAIVDHFGEEYSGIPIAYSLEESPLGTGGGIRQALALSDRPDVFVMNGDTYVSIDFAAMSALHRQAQQSLTMSITEVPDVGRYGGVTLEGTRVIGFTEKGSAGPGWINAGVYLIQRHFAWPDDLGERFSFEQAVLSGYVLANRPQVYKATGKFIDIGIPEDFDRAQTELAILSQ